GTPGNARRARRRAARLRRRDGVVPAVLVCRGAAGSRLALQGQQAAAAAGLHALVGLPVLPAAGVVRAGTGRVGAGRSDSSTGNLRGENGKWRLRYLTGGNGSDLIHLGFGWPQRQSTGDYGVSALGSPAKGLRRRGFAPTKGWRFT